MSSPIRALHVVSVALAAVAISGACSAENVPVLKTIGIWEIGVDPSLSNGCFMLGGSASGDAVRIGFDRKDGFAYTMLGNTNWKSLVVGQEYPLKFTFDGFPPWTVSALAVDMHGETVLNFRFSSQELLREVAHSGAMTTYYNDHLAARIPLPRSAEAVDELIKCQNRFEVHA